MSTTTTLTCDMEEGCTAPVTHIDIKGYSYCREHGNDRKGTCRCRLLKPKELKQLQGGEPLSSY